MENKNVKGYQFDRMRVTPANDSLLYHHLNGRVSGTLEEYLDQLKVTSSGLNVYVAKGAAVIHGRLVEVLESTKLVVPANSKGYIVATIDLTKTNTSTGTPGSDDYNPVNNQVGLEVVQNLIQQDLNQGGKIYNLPIASYTSNANTATVTQIVANMYEVKYNPGFGDYTAARGVRIYKVGNMAYITGFVKVPGSTKLDTVFEWGIIPEAVRPKKQNQFYVGQGNQYRSFINTIKTDGTIAVSWIPGTGRSSTASSNWDVFGTFGSWYIGEEY